MIKKIIRIFLKIIMWFFISTIGVTVVYRFIPPPVTPLMVIRMFEQAADEKRNVRLSKDWLSLDEISIAMPKAVIASEDQNFATHFGLDFEAIEKAKKFNAKHKGKRIKGASTISQQTAKNVFLWPNRSYLRKGLEVYFTFLIEIFWSKYRIMEVYLNVIEFGDGIYGVEAASQKYFNKSAADLDKSQAALMAACLPNPLKWTPSRPTSYIKAKQRWIIRQTNRMKKPEFIDSSK